MKKRKVTTVTLTSPIGEQEFTLDHAEQLLDMGEYMNGGWKLPKDSKYIYDEENGLRLKSNKADSVEA